MKTLASIVIASTVAVASTQAGLDKAWEWKCVGDIATPVRRYWSDDIECASWNGKDCLWSGTMAKCNQVIADHKLNEQPTKVLPLRCGDDTKSKWGITGYDGNHWCAKATSLVAAYPEQKPWTCIPGIHVPVRVNHWGEVECMSGNRKNCYWKSNAAECQHLIANPPSRQIPLDCGAAHQTEWGRRGYAISNHWCQRAAAFFGVEK